MKRELPILFSTDMVQAILQGRKKQTRRLVKPQPHPKGSWVDFNDGRFAWSELTDIERISASGPKAEKAAHIQICPFGKPGDLLYVRETALVLENYTANNLVYPGARINLRYLADGHEASMRLPERMKPVRKGNCLSNGCFKEAARIWLHVTGVRVERLQDISEEDAIAEGATQWTNAHPALKSFAKTREPNYRTGFAKIWLETYGEESWRANPWVWVISFDIR